MDVHSTNLCQFCHAEECFQQRAESTVFSFLYAITQFPLFIHVYVIEFIWPNFRINTNNH